MDLNLKAFIDFTYLVPIAITLRKVYAPSFDVPQVFLTTLAKLDKSRGPRSGYMRRHRGMPREHGIHA